MRQNSNSLIRNSQQQLRVSSLLINIIYSSQGTHSTKKFIRPNELTAFMKRNAIPRNLVNGQSPLIPKSAKDEATYVLTDYDEVGRQGQVFVPAIQKWFRVPSLAMHYMIVYKKKAFFN